MNIKTLWNHKLIKSATWYTLTDFFLKGTTIITVPIFTRLLTTEDYGRVSFFSAWAGIFSILISLGLSQSIGRGKIDFEDHYNQFASSLVFLSLLLLSCSVMMAILFTDIFLNLTGLSEVLFFIMLVQAYFSFIKTFTIAKLRYEYKYKLVSVITVIATIIGILLSIVFILNFFEHERYLGKILGGVIPTAIFGSAAVTILLVKGKTYINTSYWKYALGLSLPLMIHNFGSILNSSFDRIIISRYLGDSATGIYSFAYSVGMIPLIFLSSTNSAWNPWFFEKMRDGKHEDIRRSSKIYRDVFTIAYAGLLLISPELVKLLAEQSYWEGMYLLPWIFMAVYFQFMYKYEVRVEIYYKKTSLISAGTLFSAGINVGLNILLVPIYGYPAAAVTTAISYFLLFIFHYILTTKVIKFNLHGLWFHMQSLIYVGLTTSFYLIARSSILMRISGIIILLVLLYFVANRADKSA